jgi:beta-glucanase (GH16 family)
MKKIRMLTMALAAATPAWAQTTVVSATGGGVNAIEAPQTQKLTYKLGPGSESWPTDKRAAVVQAMDEATAFYNSIGDFPREVTASYNPGTPTADGNINGTIRFGGQISRRVALHELGHVLGVGTADGWQAMIHEGTWTGKNALAQLRAFDGPDAVLHADRQHFWPYGLNYDKESSPEADRRHVLMVAAFRRDLGLPVSVRGTMAAGAVAPVNLAGRNFLTVPGSAWKLIWHDEFDGDTLDKTKWSIGLPWGGTDGTGRHHNDQYASYIMDDDIAVRDGSLHLTTQKRDVTDKKNVVWHYTEGLITTNKSFQTRYGYFEIRAKMPTEAGAGTWPAFWTLSDGWPPEFDIIEYWGSDNRIHQGTVTRGKDGKDRWESYHRANVCITGWHTFGLEWGPGYQHYNIDGVVNNSLYGEHLADPVRTHYLLLNSGVDARRPPTPGTAFPNDFEVDWVRVYERPDVPGLQNGGFETAAAPWTRSGEGAVVDYGARTGARCLRLDAALDKPASFGQKVFGLRPNTRYVLTAWAKTTGEALAELGASEFGGTDSLSQDATKLSEYSQISTSFTTGISASSATIACRAEGNGSAFFDDVTLEQSP